MDKKWQTRANQAIINDRRVDTLLDVLSDGQLSGGPCVCQLHCADRERERERWFVCQQKHESSSSVLAELVELTFFMGD